MSGQVDPAPGVPSAGAPPPSAPSASVANAGVRRWLTWILIVLTCVTIVMATASVWTHRTLLDGDTWVRNVTGPIIRDPAVVDELSANLTDRVFTGLNVQQRLEALLPEPLKPIAGLLVASLENRVEGRVHQFLSSPQAQAAWDQASLIAHQQIVGIIRGESTVITSQDGTIYLDLRGLLQTVLQALQTSGVIPASIEIPDFSSFETPERVQEWLQTNLGLEPGTNLTLVPLGDAAGLEKAQTALRLFDVLVIVLLIASVALVALTLFVALDRRRATIQLAIGVAVSFVIAYIIVGAVQGWLVDQLTGGTLAAVGAAAVEATLDDLASWVSLLVGVSVVIAVVAYLLSGPRWLRALPHTRAGRWAAANMGAMRAAGLIIPLGLLLILPRGPVLILAIVALAATYQIILTGLARDVAALSAPAPGTEAAPQA